MSNDILDRIRRELDDMRGKVDHLRVKASLGKMELRDAVADLKHTFEPTYEKARTAATEAAQSGARETQAIAKSLLAGWDEVRRTYKSFAKDAGDDDSKS
jgi:hypothetical protein